MIWLVLILLGSPIIYSIDAKKCSMITSCLKKMFLAGYHKVPLLDPFYLFCFTMTFQTIYVIYVPGKDVFIIESRLSADMKHIANWCTQNELILNLKEERQKLCYSEHPKVKLPNQKTLMWFLLTKMFFSLRLTNTSELRLKVKLKFILW